MVIWMQDLGFVSHLQEWGYLESNLRHLVYKTSNYYTVDLTLKVCKDKNQVSHYMTGGSVPT